MAFNPKVKEFLEKNPNKTLIGLAWSLYWRIWVVIMGIYLIIIIALFLIIGIFSGLGTMLGS